MGSPTITNRLNILQMYWKQQSVNSIISLNATQKVFKKDLHKPVSIQKQNSAAHVVEEHYTLRSLGTIEKIQFAKIVTLLNILLHKSMRQADRTSSDRTDQQTHLSGLFKVTTDILDLFPVQDLMDLLVENNLLQPHEFDLVEALIEMSLPTESFFAEDEGENSLTPATKKLFRNLDIEEPRHFLNEVSEQLEILETVPPVSGEMKKWMQVKLRETEEKELEGEEFNYMEISTVT